MEYFLNQTESCQEKFKPTRINYLKFNNNQRPPKQNVNIWGIFFIKKRPPKRELQFHNEYRI